MVMTREEKAYELMLEEARAKVRALEADCPHILDDGRCQVCKKDFGWSCPESPDGACHYDAWRTICGWMWRDIHGTEHMVPKENVKKYIRPNEDMPYYSDEDCCIFCGHPYERK